MANTTLTPVPPADPLLFNPKALALAALLETLRLDEERTVTVYAEEAA